MSIASLPIRNPHISAVGTKSIFEGSDIDRLLRSVSDKSWIAGEVGVGDQQAPTFGVNNSVRQMTQQQVRVAKDGFPLSRIITEASGLNSIAWRFQLCGFVADDMPWIMRYQERGDHNDWHIDIGHSVNGSRKLGFTVQLSGSSEYDGGDLEFLNAEYDRDVVRQRGTMILFPAYFAHRVTPVTRGERLALVGWLHGDSYT